MFSQHAGYQMSNQKLERWKKTTRKATSAICIAVKKKRDQSYVMPVIHKSFSPLLPEPSTEFGISKLQEIQGDEIFPWSDTERPVAQPHVFTTCRRFL